jgi:hypothetical protein
MSVRHLPLCRRDLGIGGVPKAILRALADRANDDGVTWVGEDALVADTEFSRRAVFEGLAKLRKAGIIGRCRVDGRLAWRLTIPDASAPGAQVPVATSAPPAPKSAPGAQISAPGAPEVSVKQQEALGLDAPSLTLVPPPEPKGRRCRLPSDFVLTDALRDAAADRGMSRTVMDREFKAFCDYHASKASLMASWDAAWRTWAGNHVKFNGGRRAAPDGEVIYR